MKLIVDMRMLLLYNKRVKRFYIQFTNQEADMVELLMEHYGFTEIQAIKLMKMSMIEVMAILQAKQQEEIAVLDEKQ